MVIFPYFPEAADLPQSSEMYRLAHIGLYLRTCASVVGVFEYVYAQWTYMIANHKQVGFRLAVESIFRVFRMYPTANWSAGC